MFCTQRRKQSLKQRVNLCIKYLSNSRYAHARTWIHNAYRLQVLSQSMLVHAICCADATMHFAAKPSDLSKVAHTEAHRRRHAHAGRSATVVTSVYLRVCTCICFVCVGAIFQRMCACLRCLCTCHQKDVGSCLYKYM